MESSRQLAELGKLYFESVAKTAGEKLEKMEKDDDAFGSPNKKKKAKRWWNCNGRWNDNKNFRKSLPYDYDNCSSS